MPYKNALEFYCKIKEIYNVEYSNFLITLNILG